VKLLSPADDDLTISAGSDHSDGAEKFPIVAGQIGVEVDEPHPVSRRFDQHGLTPSTEATAKVLLKDDGGTTAVKRVVSQRTGSEIDDAERNAEMRERAERALELKRKFRLARVDDSDDREVAAGLAVGVERLCDGHEAFRTFFYEADPLKVRVAERAPAVRVRGDLRPRLASR
jgi:hypothetical protein